MTDMQTLLAGMVRPLEFNDRNCADVYSVKEGYGQTPKAFFMARGILIIGHYDTANEAEAAAQADYTARILAALNPDAVLALVAAAYADAAQTIDTAGDSAVTESLGQQLCCNGHHCGCQGTDVGTFLLHLIRARTPTDATAALARMLAEARAEGYAQAQSDECGCRLGEDCAICDARAMKGEWA